MAKYKIDILVSISTTLEITAKNRAAAERIALLSGTEGVSIDTVLLPSPEHDVDIISIWNVK